MGKKSGVVVLVLLVAAATVYFLYPWYKERERRVETAKQALNIIRQNIAESNALAALGDINIDPAGLTLAKLNAQLQRSAHEMSERPNNSKSIMMGWGCGGDLCTLRAFFPASSDGPLSPSATPIALWISNYNGFGKPFQGSIGGIHLDDPTEKLIAICGRRGYKPDYSEKRISWDKDWDIRWIAMDDKITSLYFFNRTLMDSAKGQTR